MRQKLFRKLLFPFALLLIFLLSIYFLFTYHHDSRAFTELTTELFKSELLPNTLNMHYTVANPGNYGIYSYDAVLPVYSRRQELLSNAQLENTLSSLAKLHPESLSEEDAYTLQLLQTYLQNAREEASFPYYEEPLSPNSGMQSQLPILLAEYAFRNKRDVLDYLTLLSQVDTYFDGLIRYEQEKAAAGLFMSDSSLEKVQTQCASILDEKSLAAGTHFLQTTFVERLEDLEKEKRITQKERENYISANNQLLTTIMLPAYESLSDALLTLKGKGTNSEGLAHFPQGQAYYECLLRHATGSYRSIEEMKKLLYKRFDMEYQTLQNLLSQDNTLRETAGTLDSSLFPFSTPEGMLKNLALQMEADFPSLPLGIRQKPPTCQLKAVSKSLEPFSAPAFYLTPPIDDSSKNVIYINEQNRPTGLTLYTTLAHEGYPGHLYQSVYHQLYSQKTDANPVRELLWYGGYLEGWAVYTEFLSFDYAARAFEEAGQTDAALACSLEQHSRSLQLCLYSILDLAIHYDGVSLSEASRLLNSFGITDSASQQAVYEYIVEEPANYLKYYLGYLEILELKEKARLLWGADYSDLCFHKFFLDCGPSDFESLARQLK